MFCKKCGEIIPIGADFCMSCGTKVDDVDNAKVIKKETYFYSDSSLENKPSAFHVEKKPEFTNSSNMKNNTNDESKSNKKSKVLKIGKLNVKKKLLFIIIFVLVGMVLAGGIGYYAFTELTPQGKYFKGMQVYNYLCNYRCSNNDLNNYTVDDECLKKLEEGRDYFEQAGDFEDAKLFYYSFKAYTNLVKTNANGDSSTTAVFIKQAISDITYCTDNKLVPKDSDISPESNAQKLYMYAKANIYMGAAGGTKDIKGIRFGYDMFDTLRVSNNGPYWFCGKDTDSLQAGLDILLFEYGA